MAANTMQPFTWLRCTNCRAGLWKHFGDHLEMSVSPRGGQTRIIRVPASEMAALTVVCEKCGFKWTGEYVGELQDVDHSP